MTGELMVPAALRPGDPARLGPYELLGRLGQGGMGTVYLARSPSGILVAVKMVRADLATDEEFRRRFRSEVERARQVPPFCTAEVLDADPDHEHPYLVVEYVDGPTLEDVVRQRGPLTAANLHGVAIGVATALTAIHGAGIVHRDLKPRNVLLAPGSPKVIDFGIARVLDATSSHTGGDQLVGTVSYMAPERFGPDPGTTVTTAADIFAWGAVVAYAGTGRTPFGADSPPATAGRILTQPPDLHGLAGPLRALIADSLAKQPTDRPTARELLDLLLSAGPQRSPATTAALAHQPGLRVAAQAAAGGAPTSVGPRGEPAAAAGAGTVRLADASESTRAVEGVSTAPEPKTTRQVRIPTQPTAGRVGPAHPVGQGGPVEEAGPVSSADPVGSTDPSATVAVFAVDSSASEPTVGPAEPAAVQAPDAAPGPAADAAPAGRTPARRWWWPALVATAVAMVVGAVTVVVLGGSPSTGGAPETHVAGATPWSGGGPDDALLFTDSLKDRRLWNPTFDAAEHAGCSFAGALIVRRQSPGSFRCQGPLDVQPTDERVDVGVRLLTRGSCAAIWFRFRDNHGYQVRVCESALYVGAHTSPVPEVYKTFPLIDHPVVVGAPSTRISVSARGGQVAVARDGEPIGQVPLTNPDITGGRVVLGIFTEPAGPGHTAPFEVAFDNVSVFALRP